MVHLAVVGKAPGGGLQAAADPAELVAHARQLAHVPGGSGGCPVAERERHGRGCPFALVVVEHLAPEGPVQSDDVGAVQGVQGCRDRCLGMRRERQCLDAA
jgi:hypothetical protein